MYLKYARGYFWARHEGEREFQFEAQWSAWDSEILGFALCPVVGVEPK